MKALDIAKQKAKEKKEQQERKRLEEQERDKLVQRRGDELGCFVENVLEQFSNEFDISRVCDKVWKLFKSKNKQLYITLRYDTSPWKGSDDSPTEPFNQWVVTVEVPDYKYGKYNPIIKCDTKMETAFCYLDSNFEEKFGEYMSKYYES